MKTLTVLLLAFTLVSCKAQNQIDIDNLDSLIITNTSLAELCSSNDEIECFANWFSRIGRKQAILLHTGNSH
jgi:uncharacterized protein YcfL